ncbi:MAG: HypC/HybG/HupF family hydrogenase formation chaperone [Nocardioides sp.]
MTYSDREAMTMHELAIAESVVDAVLRRTEGRPVSVVRLRVGRLISVDPGQWVLIHMGFALERIDEAKANEAMSGLEMMGQAREPLEQPVAPHA